MKRTKNETDNTLSILNCNGYGISFRLPISVVLLQRSHLISFIAAFLSFEYRAVIVPSLPLEASWSSRYYTSVHKNMWKEVKHNCDIPTIWRSWSSNLPVARIADQSRNAAAHDGRTEPGSSMQAWITSSVLSHVWGLENRFVVASQRPGNRVLAHTSCRRLYHALV